MRYYFSLIFIIILFSGCGVKKSSIDIHSYPKLTELNQESYDEELFSKEVSYHLSSNLVSRFFEVWSTEANIEDSDLWGVDYTKSRIGYGRNLLKYTQKEKNSFIVNADAKNYPSLDRDAILVRDSNFRVMPTSEPFFYNPKKAGEGYPFDYFQNSRVYANTPLKVVHKSLDGAWVYAISYFVKGWVSVEDIVFVDEGFKSEFISSTLVGVVKEPLLIKDRDGFLITKLHIGTLLPFRDNRALLARKFGSKKAFIEKLELNDALLELPLTPSIKNFTTIAKRMIGEKYSWGGKDGKRDCSMFTRDFYIPFGIYLPRNSRAQAFFEDGEYVDISGMDWKEKSDYILQNGKPYLSLLYKKGHIMLYVGSYKGKPMIVHDLWGIKTLDDGVWGRYIIGRTLLSPLDIGARLENADRDSLIINQVEGIKTINTKRFYE